MAGEAVAPPVCPARMVTVNAWPRRGSFFFTIVLLLLLSMGVGVVLSMYTFVEPFGAKRFQHLFTDQGSAVYSSLSFSERKRENKAT